MRKLAERVRDWTHGQDERLRLRLEALPQRTKLAIVLVIFAFFAVCALFTFGAALYQIGKENGRQIEIEHIKQLDLPQKQDSINHFDKLRAIEFTRIAEARNGRMKFNLYKYYDYGTERTEQKSDGLPERGEA